MRQREVERMLAQVGRLTEAQRRKVLERLQGSQATAAVVALIQARSGPPRRCCHCQGERLVRHGQASGLQRYKCRGCGRSFNALTGTPLARLRQKEKWLEQADALLLGLTIRQAAAQLQVAQSTAFRWRHRFLTLPNQCKPAILTGVVELDETYLRRSCKGQRVSGRASRRRGGTAPLRGVSKEHLPVLVACERSGAATDFMLEARDRHEVRRVLQPLLPFDAVVCTDGSALLATAMAYLRLEHHPVPRTAGRRAHGPWHLQTVNAYHGRLKQWLRRFNGVATFYLGNYLGWFRALRRSTYDAAASARMLALALAA